MDDQLRATMESCARAVSELAAHRLMAMVEPSPDDDVAGAVDTAVSLVRG